MTIKILQEQGQPNTEIARMLQVSEGTIRYHQRRRQQGATDHRKKPCLIEQVGLVEDIGRWWESASAAHPGRSPNVQELHDWLVQEHGYQGSVKSVRKYVRGRFERPPLRPWRRIETPPGLQAQVDWSEEREVDLGDGEGPRTLYTFHLKLSHSRKQVDIVCPGCDQMWWHTAHVEAFRRIGGVPAVIRIDNLRTGVASGAGPWGELNASYAAFAQNLGFIVDPCLPRNPRQKGKVERGVRTYRLTALRRMSSMGLAALQDWIDQEGERRSQRQVCPITGTTVEEAWQAERVLLRSLPTPCPQPFDVVVVRPVQRDCLVNFEGRQYAVPFLYCREQVEVRGCAGTVQIVARDTGQILKTYPRGTQARLLIDPQCYEGEGTPRVSAPVPLGRLASRIQELEADGVERRSVDWYAELVETAR